jgi:hypothetical protein
MFKPLKILAAAGLFAATASIASAAPATSGQASDGLTNGVSSSIIDVQYRDREYRGRWDRGCRRGPGGWYRINRFGERRPCREWRGGGRRPDACVKAGPIYFCDY